MYIANVLIIQSDGVQKELVVSMRVEAQLCARVLCPVRLVLSKCVSGSSMCVVVLS